MKRGSSSRVILINEKDNVAVALHDIAEGAEVILPGGARLTALDAIPYSHKIAVDRIGKGESILKYGEVIGVAGEDIEKGSWVHTHNLGPAGGDE